MPDAQQGELIDQGALPPDDFHESIERIREIADYDIELPEGLFDTLNSAADNLLIDKSVLSAAAAALTVGHLVLQGPPGTGKSSLARILCHAFHCNVYPVTAHEDWTTFELIGRQELRFSEQGEQILPVNGFFTEAVIRCAGAIVKHSDAPEEPQAEWLLIDELNRARMDKAFGELFTVLGTDVPVPITLPHQRIGNRELVTPRRFRIIATLNSVDRQFVNSLSQGLRRRFTFITVDIPRPRRQDEPWGSTDPQASLASREYTIVLTRALKRVVARHGQGDINLLPQLQVQLESILQQARETLEALFALVETVRYAKQGEDAPHLPLGTAQLIDTVELFLTRAHIEGTPPKEFGNLVDWATSVRLAPLFEADSINPGDLEKFADSLSTPFDRSMRRELQQIVAAGTYFVE